MALMMMRGVGWMMLNRSSRWILPIIPRKFGVAVNLSPLPSVTVPCCSFGSLRKRSRSVLLPDDRAEVPVIRIPQRMVKKVEQALKEKQAREDEERMTRMFEREKPLILSCKRRHFNFRLGQQLQAKPKPFLKPNNLRKGGRLIKSTNSNFQQVVLASHAWTHRKSVGDHFTIRPVSDNPALRQYHEPGNAKYQPGFDKFNLQPELIAALRHLDTCTTIQNDVIPVLLQGDSAICASETGSGKTLAYLVPAVEKLIIEHKDLDAAGDLAGNKVPINAPSVLVIVPSRELAAQIYQVALRLVSNTNISVHNVIGGERTQLKLTRPSYRSVDLLISTPGVLSKLLTNRIFSLSHLSMIVIDEADTLLDDSFSDVVKHILRGVAIRETVLEDNKLTTDTGAEPHQLEDVGAQLVLVGATMPRGLDKILEGLIPLKSLTRVTTPFLHRVQPHVRQKFLRLSKAEKPGMLLRLVRDEMTKQHPVMIFCNDSPTCDWLALFLQENGVQAANLNGEMHQRIRRGRFDLFSSGQVQCLVCTDIASRGLDTTFVEHVINYDFPRVASDYIHRSGRTGRVGAATDGQVTSLVAFKSEIKLVQEIEQSVRKSCQFQNVNANITRLVNARKNDLSPGDVDAISYTEKHSREGRSNS